MKQAIAKLLKKEVGLSEEEIIPLLEIPPSLELGDYSFPCFVLAGKLKQNPSEIAEELKRKLNLPKEIEKIKVSGSYLNFYMNKKLFAEKIIKEILSKKENYGKGNSKGKIMVEFPSPNTNKPLHLGHLRNMAIGESVSRILEFNNQKVVRANLYNDRGIHICKSMLAYQKYGKGKSPSIKLDHFVGKFYVLFNQKFKENKKLEQEAQELLQKWEAGDKKTIALWKKMNNWALKGFKETYKLFGIRHDKEYYESKIYKKGKEIIFQGLKEKVFEKREGVILINLGKELGEKILLRSDGTSVYITQDLYLAKLKYEDFNLTGSIYVVGNEQDYHFKVLFTILEKLGFAFSNNLKHLSYGMVLLPEGKMKSREGNVVDADDLIEKVRGLVEKELKSRDKLSKKELKLRSLKIALAAIKYFLLKVDLKKNMVFNPKESINFEGDTGPYLQYSYARANSILKKIKIKKVKHEIFELSDKEMELVKKLSQFPEIIEKSFHELNPSVIANYSYQLSKIFNEFYHDCPVINSKQEFFRIELVKSFMHVLKNCLHLIGIDVLEKM